MKPSKIMRLCLAAFWVISIWLPSEASAQWLGFLRLDGVTGESADTNHVGWMDIISASTSNLTNSNPHSLPGTLGGPTNGPLCFEKKVDKASPTLNLFCANNTPILSGTLDLARSNTTLVQFLRLNLTNVLVSSVSSAGNSAGETRPLEEVCLTARAVSWNYTQFNPASGLPQSYTGSIWDFQSNSGSGSTNNPLFVVSGIRRNSGIEITWPATPGKTYRIYSVLNLNGMFTPLAQISAPAAGGPMTYSPPTDSPAMFFIVEQAP